jgi:hypothetical protein
VVVLYAARHRVPVPCLARWLLGLGIAATLTANMAQGWSRGPVGAVVAAWPALSLVGSYELLVWLIRTSGTIGHRPPAGHPGDAAPCRAAAHSAAAAAPGAGFVRRGERDTPDQARQPTAQATEPPASPASSASGQRDQAVPETDAVNGAAVTAYRLSAQAGNPLSERKLAQMFGRTSRRWARARIADARRIPSTGPTGDPAATIGTQLPSRPASTTRPTRHVNSAQETSVATPKTSHSSGIVERPGPGSANGETGRGCGTPLPGAGCCPWPMILFTLTVSMPWSKPGRSGASSADR